MKTGNSQPDAMAQPPMGTESPMDGGMEMPQDNMMGGEMPPMDGGADTGMGMQPMGGGESQFDTNFDAGVEADEDTDPEKYIQQLTGKLSTTLNSFNSENGDNSGLNKYVAKMIVKAATKDMDDASKKEIIKAINTSDNPEPADNPGPVDDMNAETPDMQGQDMAATDMGQQPMQERILTKKQLMEMAKRRKN